MTMRDDVRAAWNANARFWDERMGDGNDFVDVLIWPAVERLLGMKRGDRVLDVACGNGLTSRRLASAGAEVVAIDFSEGLIDIARRKSSGIDYRVVDVTDYDALLSLGIGRFDSALCNMAFMDIADLGPMMHAMAQLLMPRGAFVFSMLHPCFNNPKSVQLAELEDREGTMTVTYSVKIPAYLTPFSRLGVAMADQPLPHPYFHRPLSDIVATAVDAGFVLDGLEERAFPADHKGGSTALSWSGNFSEIPPVLVGRLRLAKFMLSSPTE